MFCVRFEFFYSKMLVPSQGGKRLSENNFYIIERLLMGYTHAAALDRSYIKRMSQY